MSIPLHDQLVAALRVIGEEEVANARTEQYTCFKRTHNARTRQPLPSSLHTFYFIGRNGALRVGRTATESQSMTKTGMYTALLQIGRAALLPRTFSFDFEGFDHG